MSRGEEHSPASGQEQLRRQRQEWYYQVGGPPTGETDTSSPFPHDIIRVQLTDDWDTCEDGQGVEVQLDDDGNPQQTDRQVTLRDPLGIFAGNMLYDDLAYVMPSGTYLWVMATYDGPAPDEDSPGPYYEPLNFGLPANCGSGSESSETSEPGSEEGSEPGSGEGTGEGTAGTGGEGTGGTGGEGTGGTGGTGTGGGGCPSGYCCVPCPPSVGTGDTTTYRLVCTGGVMSWVAS